MTAYTYSPSDTRRYDLDWLRVIAFGLLIFYHIGMFYVTWGWHVKSPHMNENPEAFMMLLNPWRLSLLFLISGIAFRFAIDKYAQEGKSRLRVAGMRFKRLFIPLLFGMLVIVTPQAYFELLGKGEISPGYLDFWGRYLSADDSFSITVPTWNHLWYVVYLLVYTLLIIPVMPLIRRAASFIETSKLNWAFTGWRLLVVPALIWIAYRFTTDMIWPEEKHNLTSDWGAHARYGSYFIMGILIAKNDTMWRSLAKIWRKGAWLTLTLAVVLTPLWMAWEWVTETGEPLLAIARAMRPLYAWMVIISLLGAAQAYLGRPSARLSYLTKAVFPYYILHQSLIVVIGVWLARMEMPVWVEFPVLVILTAFGCWAIYEFIIRRVAFLKPLFGVFDSGLSSDKAAETEVEPLPQK